MTTLHPNLKVIQPANEFPVELVAAHLMTISDGIKKLRAGPLTDEALFLLIQKAAPRKGSRRNSKEITIAEIKAVIEGLDKLESTFIKPVEAKKNK